MAALGSRESQQRAEARAHELNTVAPTPTRDLESYLRGEYRRGIPYRLTRREPTATGQALADRLVGRLEIANALRALTYRQRRGIELALIEDKPNEQVAALLNISLTTLAEDRRQALKAMVERIYEWE